MEPVPVAWVSLMRPPAPVSAPAAVQAIRCEDHLQHMWQVMQAKRNRLLANGVQN